MTDVASRSQSTCDLHLTLDQMIPYQVIGSVWTWLGSRISLQWPLYWANSLGYLRMKETLLYPWYCIWGCHGHMGVDGAGVIRDKECDTEPLLHMCGFLLPHRGQAGHTHSLALPTWESGVILCGLVKINEQKICRFTDGKELSASFTRYNQISSLVYWTWL